MKWIKLREPYRMELIKETELVDRDGNVIAKAGKDSQVPGRVTHFGSKRIGANSVTMYRFWPDSAPYDCWELSRGWFRRERKEKEDAGVGSDKP